MFVIRCSLFFIHYFPRLLILNIEQGIMNVEVWANASLKIKICIVCLFTAESEGSGFLI